MILHEKYNNGKIVLIDKSFSKIKANVKISIIEEEKGKKFLKKI